MRRTALIAALIVSAASGGPASGKKEITEKQFQAMVFGIKENFLDEHPALTELAKKYVVRRRARLASIRDARWDRFLIVCCEMRGEMQEWKFFFPNDKRDAVKGWKKWDRISWLCEIEVWEDQTRFRWLVKEVSDLTRTPNPGPEPPDWKAMDVPYREWRKDVLGLVKTQSWDRLEEEIEKVGKRAFPVEVVVVKKLAYGMLRVRVSKDDVGVAQDTAGAREEGGNLVIPVGDPQILEVVKKGDRAVVGVFPFIMPRLLRTLRVDGYRYFAQVRFWRLKDTPASSDS